MSIENIKSDDKLQCERSSSLSYVTEQKIVSMQRMTKWNSNESIECENFCSPFFICNHRLTQSDLSANISIWIKKTNVRLKGKTEQRKKNCRKINEKTSNK